MHFSLIFLLQVSKEVANNGPAYWTVKLVHRSDVEAAVGAWKWPMFCWWRWRWYGGADWQVERAPAGPPGIVDTGLSACVVISESDVRAFDRRRRSRTQLDGRTHATTSGHQRRSSSDCQSSQRCRHHCRRSVYLRQVGRCSGRGVALRRYLTVRRQGWRRAERQRWGPRRRVSRCLRHSAIVRTALSVCVGSEQRNALTAPAVAAGHSVYVSTRAQHNRLVAEDGRSRAAAPATARPDATQPSLLSSFEWLIDQLSVNSLIYVITNNLHSITPIPCHITECISTLQVTIGW